MPPAWGDEATARERLAPAFDEVKISRDTYRLAFPFGPNLALDFFLQNMGPVRQAYAFLKTPEKQQALRDDLEQFFQKTNQGKPEAFQVDSEYLLVEARKRG
jgi:hypothetical protein